MEGSSVLHGQGVQAARPGPGPPVSLQGVTTRVAAVGSGALAELGRAGGGGGSVTVWLCWGCCSPRAWGTSPS